MWQQALARHHLLYPECTAPTPAHSTPTEGESFLAGLVEGVFDDHISSNLGDWVNGDGGSGSIGIHIAGRLICYRANYDSINDCPDHTGQIKRARLFGALLETAAKYGVGRIEAELDFDSDGHSWSQSCYFQTAAGLALTLDTTAQTELLRACHATLCIHGRRYAPAATEVSEQEFALWFWDNFVEKPVLALETPDEMEDYCVTMTLSRGRTGPVLNWVATFRVRASDDGDSGEIAAPVIVAQPVKTRSRKRRAA